MLENGYHTLEMIMQSISLCDEVSLEKADALCVDCPGVPQQKNTAYCAAKLFFESSGIAGGAAIRIKKRIPREAGLGGGSADAAATLLGLNQLYGFPLSEEALAALALKIGADAPFFLKRRLPAVPGRGRGALPGGKQSISPLSRAPAKIRGEHPGRLSEIRRAGRRARGARRLQSRPGRGESSRFFRGFLQQFGAGRPGALPRN